MALSVIDVSGFGAALGQEVTKNGQAFLDRGELARLEAFSSAKRQRQWLGGRIAAKRAALQLVTGTPDGGNGFHRLRIENDAMGRPYLHAVGKDPAGVAPGSLPEISISHSGHLAAGLAVSPYPCGVDIQKVTAKTIAVSDRFVTAAERAVLRAAAGLRHAGEAEALTLLWAAKESLRKAVACQPLLGFQELHLTHLGETTPHGGMIARCLSPRLAARVLPPIFLALHGGYALAIAINHCREP